METQTTWFVLFIWLEIGFHCVAQARPEAQLFSSLPAPVLRTQATARKPGLTSYVGVCIHNAFMGAVI